MQQVNNTIKDILSFQPFVDILDRIKNVDKETAGNFEVSLKKRLENTCEVLADKNKSKKDKLLAIKTAKLELHALSAPYLRISEQLTKQKQFFDRTAMQTSNDFLDFVYNSIDDYFETIYLKIETELENNSSMFTGIKDSWKKTGAKGINICSSKFKEILGYKEAEKKLLDDQTLLEKTLENICSSEEIQKKVTNVFQEAAVNYEKTWKKRVAEYHQKVKQFDSQLAKLSQDAISLKPEFSLGLAEQTLATAFGATLVGTLSLAAGWHTLAYALSNVFLPIAIFAALLTLFVAWWKENDALQKRIDQVKKLLNTYHAQIILFIDTHPLEEHQNKSIRKLLIVQSFEMAKKLNKQWREVRYGLLTESHYEEIITAITSYLQLLDKAENSCQIN